jgi:hypothetical protein
MIISDNILNSIYKYISKHHELYSTSVKAEQWEEILFKALTENNVSASWDSGSHKVGEDIKTKEFGRISCKGGALKKSKYKNESLTISGSRTTSYKTLDSKIEYLSNNHDDYYFCLAKYSKDIDSGNYHYKLIAFPSKLIKPNNLKWKEKGKNFCAEGIGITQTIQTSMSGQLWTVLDVSLTSYQYDITV